MTDPSSSFEYDRVAYPGVADQSIHLRNLEVTATMFGAQPANLNQCRVLEIGCADGANMLPYAHQFPTSRFVGIDLAKDRIRVASEIADEVGIENATFHCANIVDIDKSIGTFDFILCPGVFSWVGDEERQAILRVCRECLAPDGIAAISYNVRPGWNWNDSVRDFIRDAVRTIDDPQQQIAAARNAVEFLAANGPSQAIHSAYYQRACDRLRSQSDTYLYHDYITDQNRPFYFREFAEMADVHSLKFLGEADFRHSSGFGLDMNGRAAVAQTPPAHRETLLDFLLNTGYRSSMLCHKGCTLQPRVQHEWVAQLQLALFDPMDGVTFDLSSGLPLTLPLDGGVVTVTDPGVKAALRHLMDRWPQTVSVEQLFAAVRDFTTGLPPDETAIDGPESLAQTMLAFYGAGLVRPFKSVPPWNDEVTDRCQASPVVRAAAARGLGIVNQWHQNIRHLSSGQRKLLSLLDGTRDVKTLASMIAADDTLKSDVAMTSDGVSTQGEFGIEAIAKTLHWFAKKRLLVN
tara:strand:- start:132203 stop:133759 length:1557 start_codon:yes stop_codon:yes gene_type:complete